MINEELDAQVDSLETESEVEEVEEVEESSNEPDWKSEALKYKAILERTKEKKKEAKQTKQSDDFDYGEYAYLAQKGIESDDDIKFVKDSMKDSGKNLREVLGANWFKAELEERKALSKTTNAIPRGRNANSTAVDSVEYWLGKPIEEVPQEMRVKVVNARLAKENSGGKFYNS